MNQTVWWWALAGALVALELVVGTVYLLMVAVGAVAGALAAQAGLGLTAQLAIAAAVGAGAVAGWHPVRARRPAAAPAAANKSVNLDVGEEVMVHTWGPDRTSTVHYRGAEWAVSLQAGAAAHSGLHRIAEVQGSRLVLEPLTLPALPG